MIRLAPLLFLMLAACDSPSPAYMGIPAQRLDVGGMTFSIRQKGEAAEILRLSFEKMPRRADVFPLAEQATEQATGCKVRKLDGDPAIMQATLDC